MSCGKCPEFKEKFSESKFKDRTKKPQQEAAPEPEPVPVPVQEKKKSWWEKLKDRIDPAGIGGLLPQTPGMGFGV